MSEVTYPLGPSRCRAPEWIHLHWHPPREVGAPAPWGCSVGSRLVTIPSGDNLGNSVRLAVDVDYRDRDGLLAAGEEADRWPRCLHLET